MTVSSDFDDEPDRRLLLRHLAGQRQHVLHQMEGLNEEQLRRSVLPSGWSCLGLVRHLTLSDERYWFHVVVAGGELDFWPDEEGGDWRIGDDDSKESVIDEYRVAIARSNAIYAETPLGTAPRKPEPWWAEVGLSFPDLRSVVLHVITETATHAGQLDAVRELIDGRQHLVL